MRVEGMHPWWDEEEEKRRAAAIKTREPEQPVNENSFYAGAVKSGIMGAVAWSGKFKTITDFEKAIGETEKTIVDLGHQQYEHMMNGDQPKMDALTPMIGQALNVRDQLRVEMGNQMGLGTDGWASQNPNMLEQKTFSSEPLSTNVDRFTPEQQSKEDVLVGEHLLVNPNHLTPEQRSKADVYVGKDAMAGQYVPSGVTPEQARTGASSPSTAIRGGGGAGRRFDPLDSGYGNSRVQLAANDSVPMMGLGDESNQWRPEGAGSRPDDYAGMGYSEPRVEAGTISGQPSTSNEPITTGLSPELLAKSDVYVGEGIRIKEIEDKEVKSLTDKIDRYFNDMIFMSNEEFFERYPVDHKGLATKWEKELAGYIPENGEEQSRHHFEGYENMIASINQDNIFRMENGTDPYGSEDVTKEVEVESIKELSNKAKEVKAGQRTDYQVINITGQEIDKKVIDNVLYAAIDSRGEYGKSYTNAYAAEGLQIRVDSYEEKKWTKEEAQEKYLEEQEERNKLVKDMVAIVEACYDPKKFITLFANKIINGNVYTESGINQIIDHDLTLEADVKATLKGCVSGYLQDEGIDKLLNTMDTLHHDINNIRGGTYIDVKIMLSPKGSDTERPTYKVSPAGISTRLYYFDGVYIDDKDNALCEVITE